MSTVIKCLLTRFRFAAVRQVRSHHHQGPKPTGLLVAPVTPFKENGDVDYDRVPKYIDFMVKNGVRGAFVNGSNGEFPSLTLEERKRVQSIYLDYGRKNGLDHVIIHCGTSCLQDTIELAKHARSCGARAVSAIAPFYYPPKTVDALVDYLGAICREVPDTAFYYYHFPLYTKCNISLRDFVVAAKESLPTLEGIKYTDTDLAQLDAITHFDNGRYVILPGFQTLYLAGLAHGVLEPGIGGQFNFMPGVFHALRRAFDAGDLVTAQREQDKINRNMLLVNEFADYGLFQAIKEIMFQAGFDAGPPRLPLKRMSRERAALLRKELEKCGFFEFSAKV